MSLARGVRLGGLALVVVAAAFGQAPRAGSETTGMIRMGPTQPLPAEEVRALEGRVAEDGEDLAARGRLLEHYFAQGDAREWGRHELWLVEHQPESSLHRAPSGLKGPDGDVLIERLAVAWRRAVEDQAAVPVLRNAALFFAGVDAQFSLELLTRARAAGPFDGEVLQLVVGAYLQKRPAEQAPMIERALVELENGQDATVLWMVGRGLRDHSRGERLMARAKELDPDVAERAEAPKRVTVGAAEQAALLVFQPRPVWPEMAKEKGIDGVVRFTAVIGGEGELRNLTLVSGHPLLVQAAVDAVKQWRYRPTLVDGVPVEVMTQIEVAVTPKR